MASQRPDHTLQTTALVNEAFLRLAGQTRPNWQDRVHFVAVAARVMRQILVSYARNARAQKPYMKRSSSSPPSMRARPRSSS
ncbi:hypothetical protein BH20VER3_BH20VER3_20770 [soil metagenome]